MRLRPPLTGPSWARQFTIRGLVLALAVSAAMPASFTAASAIPGGSVARSSASPSVSTLAQETSAAQPAAGSFALMERRASGMLQLDSVSLRDVDVRFRFRLDRIPSTRSVTVTTLLRRQADAEYRLRLDITPSGRINATIFRAGPNRTVELERTVLIRGLRMRSGSWIAVRAQALAASSTIVRAKVWRASASQPKTWNVKGRDSNGLRTAGGAAVQARLTAQLKDPVTVEFADLRAERVTAAEGPRISNVKAVNVGRRSAEVAWKINEPSTGRVQYGRTKAYGRWTKLEPSFDYTEHIQSIAGLAPGTVYHYRVISTNKAGRTAKSMDRTFRTADGSTSPDPTPNPDPAPNPPPTDGLKVPASIDQTGSSNVSAALQSFIDQAPNGSTIIFPAGANYLLAGDGITLSGRRNLTFQGNGATLRSRGCSTSDSLFFVAGGSGITIRNLTLVGDNTQAGTSSAYSSSCEHQHGVATYAASDVVIDSVTVRQVHGDCVYLGRGSNGTWSSGVRYVDSVCELTGRQGIAIVAATDVRVARVRFDKIAINVLDIEPNTGADGATNITLTDNTVGSYSLSDRFRGFFFGANGSLDAMVRNVDVTNNTVTGGGLDSLVGDEYTGFNGQRNRRNLTFTGNRSTVSGASGPVVTFKHVDGATVTGNSQSLRNGTLARFVDSTAVTYQP